MRFLWAVVTWQLYMGVRYLPNIILGNGRKFLINDGVVFLEMNYNTQKWPSLEYFITFALSIQVVSLLFSTDIHKALFNLFMWKFRLFRHKTTLFHLTWTEFWSPFPLCGHFYLIAVIECCGHLSNPPPPSFVHVICTAINFKTCGVVDLRASDVVPPLVGIKMVM